MNAVFNEFKVLVLDGMQLLRHQGSMCVRTESLCEYSSLGLTHLVPLWGVAFCCD